MNGRWKIINEKYRSRGSARGFYTLGQVQQHLFEHDSQKSNINERNFYGRPTKVDCNKLSHTNSSVLWLHQMSVKWSQIKSTGTNQRRAIRLAKNKQQPKSVSSRASWAGAVWRRERKGNTRGKEFLTTLDVTKCLLKISPWKFALGRHKLVHAFCLKLLALSPWKWSSGWLDPTSNRSYREPWYSWRNIYNRLNTRLLKLACSIVSCSLKWPLLNRYHPPNPSPYFTAEWNRLTIPV